jgi:antitoxin (DNA-binding transcriptional repressor) of toxin-antitoxin stability system
MKQVTIAQFRAHLAAWLKRVERGERILIKRRGEVIAELRPSPPEASAGEPDDLEERLQQLEAEGFLRRGTGKWPAWSRGPITGKPAPLLEALLAEREEGR